MASPGLDLTIPRTEPALVRALHDCSTDESSFALYTMIPDMPASRLEEIATMPQSDWQTQYEQNSQLVRPAKPTANFTGQTLRDIINAHVAMDKELQPVEGGAANASWRPESFVVITNNDLEDHGLLFVYAQLEDGDEDDDEEDKIAEGEMGKFFFRPADMFDLLSSLALESYGYIDLEEKYNMDREEGEEEEEEDDDNDEENE